MSQIASFYLLKDGRRQELSNGDCSSAVYMASGTGVRASWNWMSVFLLPRRRTPWTALCWRESWRLNCWQLCGSRTSRNWPLKLPQTGIYSPTRYKADLKRCAPIWNWCGATLPCCMKCYKAEGYHAGKAV